MTLTRRSTTSTSTSARKDIATGIQPPSLLKGEHLSTPPSGGRGAGWYSLNGMRLNGKPAKKGVYIVNGKKVVVP